MSHLLRAGCALLFVALMTGSLPLGPRWHAVAAELDHVQPQARLKADLVALFGGGKG